MAFWEADCKFPFLSFKLNYVNVFWRPFFFFLVRICSLTLLKDGRYCVKILEKFSVLSIRHLGSGSESKSEFLIMLCLERLSDPRRRRDDEGACLGSYPLVTESVTFSDVSSHFSSGNTYSRHSHLHLHTCAMWLGGKQGDAPGHKILHRPRDRRWGMGSVSWVGTELGNCCFPVPIVSIPVVVPLP